MVDLIHIGQAEELILEGRSIPQEGKITKPYGLWYAEGWAWLKWCESEQFQVKTLNQGKAWKLRLDPQAAILRLSDRLKLLEFVDQYKIRITSYFIGIDWEKVRMDGWKGVEFIPYLYNFRMDIDTVGVWYSGVDVPSGCIWDVSAISRVEKIEKPLCRERVWDEYAGEWVERNLSSY